MHSDTQLLSWTRLLIVGLVVCLGVTMASQDAQAQTTFVVNSVGDDSDDNAGDGDCDTGDTIDPGDGTQVVECTLRAAIEEANAASEAAIIEFWSGFDANNYSIVEPQSSYPFIENEVTIAGETHPYYESRGEPGVLIDGENTSASGIRIRSGGSGSTIRHLGIGRFPNAGIYISNADNVEINGNEIGVLSILSLSNGRGIDVRQSSNVLIQDNRIAANDGSGIRLRDETTSTLIYDNEIGIKSTLDGLSAVGNGEYGVRVSSDAGTDNYIGICLFGGCTGNVISGNSDGGVYLGADGQHVYANLIGTDPDGGSDDGFGNGGSGVVVVSSDNQIGLSSDEASNVIVSSEENGVLVDDPSASGNIIRNNFVGTNADGDDLGNGTRGINVDVGSDTEVVGNVSQYNGSDGIFVSEGPTTLSRNTVTDNGQNGIYAHSAVVVIGGERSSSSNTIGNNEYAGIRLSHLDGAQIRGNYIGTNDVGADMGNGTHGVWLDDAGSAEIGNTEDRGDDEHANVIGFNADRGIESYRSDGVLLQGNYVGTSPSGDDLGNGDAGIYVRGSGPGAFDNVIGYAADQAVDDNPSPAQGGLGNVIAHNGSHGVSFRGSDNYELLNHAVRGNSIYANGGVGVYLGPDGDVVDVGGGDTGPNNMQNFPEFDEAETQYNESTGEIEYRYRVRTNVDNAAYPLKIDFYLPGGGDTQGQTYLGTDTYPESNATDWRIGSFEPPSDVDVSRSDQIVATATDSDGNTSQFTPTAQSLPVELVSFEATRNGDAAVHLTWQTASETDNAGFEVEHRPAGAEAFDEVGFVEGAGTTSEAQSYRYAVESVESGTHIFRLKQIDRDGAHEYSREVELTVSMSEAYQLTAPYPNPARGQAEMQLTVRERQPVTIVLYNALGQRVRTLYEGEPAAEATKTLRVDGSGLSSGLYLVRIEGERFNATETVTFVK